MEVDMIVKAGCFVNHKRFCRHKIDRRFGVLVFMATVILFSANTSTSSPAYEFAVPKPEFGEVTTDLNVTSFTGHTSRLPCTVRHLAGKQVSWIRGRDLRVLSSGRITFATDVRISVLPGTLGTSKRIRRDVPNDDTVDDPVMPQEHLEERFGVGANSASAINIKDGSVNGVGSLGENLPFRIKYVAGNSSSSAAVSETRRGYTRKASSPSRNLYNHNNNEPREHKTGNKVPHKYYSLESYTAENNIGKQFLIGDVDDVRDPTVISYNDVSEKRRRKRAYVSGKVYHNGRYERVYDYSYTKYGYLNYGPSDAHEDDRHSSYYRGKNYGTDEKNGGKFYPSHESLESDTFTQSNQYNFGANFDSKSGLDSESDWFTRYQIEQEKDGLKKYYSDQSSGIEFNEDSFHRLLENSNENRKDSSTHITNGNMKRSQRSRIRVSSLAETNYIPASQNNPSTLGSSQDYKTSSSPDPSTSLTLSSPSLSSAASLLPPNYLEGVWEPEDFTLQIKFTEPNDAGTYICQVNTEAKTAQKIHLTVIDMVAKILGPKELFVKAGTPVTLVCQVDHSASLPGFIFWYKGDRLVDYEASKGRIQVVTRREGRSDLVLTEAVQLDSANYTCGPAGGQSASVMLNVIVDERPAAMQQGNNSPRATKTDVKLVGLLLVVLLLLSVQALSFGSPSGFRHKNSHDTTIASSSSSTDTTATIIGLYEGIKIKLSVLLEAKIRQTDTESQSFMLHFLCLRIHDMEKLKIFEKISTLFVAEKSRLLKPYSETNSVQIVTYADKSVSELTDVKKSLVGLFNLKKYFSTSAAIGSGDLSKGFSTRKHLKRTMMQEQIEQGNYFEELIECIDSTREDLGQVWAVRAVGKLRDQACQIYEPKRKFAKRKEFKLSSTFEQSAEISRLDVYCDPQIMLLREDT